MEKSQSEESLGFPSMEMMTERSVSKTVAVIACAAMAVIYVAILYAPTVILRLPQPTSLNTFMIRRFICATISSVVSIFICSFLLPVRSWEASSLLSAYGIRKDHIWQAVVFPLSLTSLLYTGSFVSKSLRLVNLRSQEHIDNVTQRFSPWIISIASNVLAWRNYVVAPLTEEIVFRACMIPLLLCGGFRTYSIIFLSPVFFSLAHLNHFLDLYFQQNYSFLKAFLIVGLQLGYTVVFGSYASFLFIRTGHLVAPVVAHILCNIMGLPVLYSRSKGFITLAFVSGMVGFLWFLFPATSPDMYNDRTDDCRCWNRYCSWNQTL